MIPRCDHCPVAPGKVCRAERTNHRPYCRTMDPTREGHDPAKAAKLAPILGGEIADTAESYREELRARPDYDPAAEIPASGPTAEDLAAVAECPHRGSVLPHTLQAECGCGGELSECRAGKGKVPGRVTTRDCLACVAHTD